jgi:hypothetical protein
MKRTPLLLLLTFVLGGIGLLESCSKDDESYPNLITEMGIAYSDAQGRMTRFLTDGGKAYQVLNEVMGMENNDTTRVLTGYVIESSTTARVYTAQAVPVLHNATTQELVEGTYYDPTGVESAWTAGGFINLHLTPKTQGKKQAWAFKCDTTYTNTQGGQTYDLSLCHRQLEDPTAYTTDIYVSVDLDSVATAFAPTDSLHFTVYTFNGPRTWHFGQLTPRRH